MPTNPEADVNRKRQEIKRLRERIRESDHIDPDDRDALLLFSEELDFRDTEYSDDRHRDLLQRCTMMAGDSQKYDPDELPDTRLVDAIHDREELKKAAIWIKNTYSSEETKRDMRVALRMFAGHTTDGEPGEKPDAVETLSAGTPRNYQPMPDPTKMLYWEEHIQPMLKAATNYRDKAAIAVSWDLGARPFEFQELRVGDVVDHKHGMKVTVDGKRGQRSPLVIPSVPYLRQWLEVHPDRDNPAAPLWSKLNSGEELSYRMFLKLIKKPGRKAGIDHTDITYRRMRKSSASYLASQNVNQAHLEDHHGWKRGSDIASRYVSVFGEANDREIAKAHGIEIDSSEEPDPTAPISCPRCSRDTPRGKPACIWCGQVTSHGAAEEIEDQRADARQSMREVPGEVASAIDAIERYLGDDAGLRVVGLED